ncbi:ankyrin [Rhizodiscina lignyota]|uniref:Ankyrin n=1 Tax=Rhizodiscina lignyota TaxID=1504668 RepID=A0A9P4IDW1_9PEZI|nr:ankyrin [Rhizodiscina lignyota]
MDDPENSPAAQHLRDAIYHGDVTRVIQLLDVERAPLSVLNHSTVSQNTSVELLETLVDRGYDINRPGLQNTNEHGRTLIDYPGVLKKEAVVRWLVEHGARLDRGQEEYMVVPMPAPLLETAAVYASVPTFKLLQEHGAKLGRRTLHCAVEYAAGISLDPVADLASPMFDPKKKFGEDRKRLVEMLPFLVNELGLDVNAVDTEKVPRPSGHYGTPLCYAAYNNGVGVVKWLLSKGADPMLGGDEALDAGLMAKAMKNEKVLKVLEEWQQSRKST